jgi:acyl carrier protein
VDSNFDLLASGTNPDGGCWEATVVEPFEVFLEIEGIVLPADQMDSVLLADAGVDSLLLLQWVFLLEDRIGRQVSDDLIDSLRTVGDLRHFYNTLGG